MKLDIRGRRVEIIPGCIICKTCEFTAPNIFRVPEKSLSAEVVHAEPAAADVPAVIEAIRLCPEKVIKFRIAKNS